LLNIEFYAVKLPVFNEICKSVVAMLSCATATMPLPYIYNNNNNNAPHALNMAIMMAAVTRGEHWHWEG
jgi:hypothetical protein